MELLDTSFLIGYALMNDEHHSLASKLARDIESGMYGDPILSDTVFDEAVTVFERKNKKREIAITFGRQILSSFQIEHIDEQIFRQAWALFCEQKLSSLSFTDCTILALMREKHISHLATFDKGFLGVEGINVVGARKR